MSPVHSRRRTAIAPAAALVGLAVLVAPTAAGGPQAYAVPTAGSPYTVTPLLSVGDVVPETSSPTNRDYQMVGIPDGLGAFSRIDGTTDLFMNHEFTSDKLSEPNVGEPLNRGAFVSRFRLAANASVVSGQRAYDTVYQENIFRGPAAQEDNTTRAFSRLCSGSLSYQEANFDRPIYFAGEEDSNEAATFDGKGGQTVAVMNNRAYALPRMGRFSKENTLVQPTSGIRTVVMTLEDGPSGPDSQLYMYVGWKGRTSGMGALRRNGLDNGRLYTLDLTRVNSEADFENGSFQGVWKEVKSASEMTATELEAATDALGATGFVRIEDGAFSKTDRNDFYFVTTGSDALDTEGGYINRYGRLYKLDLDASDPTEPARLTVIYNADTVVASGGDIALSPDNIDTSTRHLMIQEDGTAETRPVFAAKNRDGSIWRIPVSRLNPVEAVSYARRVVELDPPGRDGILVGPGVWESSGIIDTTSMFGTNSWLFDVQAHPPTTPQGTNTIEDGQLLIMRRD